MSIDFERSLAELAAGVADAGTQDRMSAQVRSMVGRVRRRRAARATATGTVGLAAASAVVVGGLGATGRGPAPWGVAGLGGEPEFPACGSAALRATDLQPQPGFGIGGVDGPRPAEAPSGSTVAFTGTTVDTLVLAQDGVVVSAPAVTSSLVDSYPAPATLTLALTSCVTGEPLAPGGYDLVRRVEDVVVPGAVPSPTLETGTGGPPLTLAVPFEVTGGPAEAPEPSTPAEPLPQPTVDVEIVDPAAEYFPACGTEVLLDDGQPPLVADLTLGDGPFTSGGDVTGELLLRSTEDRTVVADFSSPYLVVVQDGVVVGRSPSDPGYEGSATISPEVAMGFELEGMLYACPTETEALVPLPPGTYDVYAAQDVGITEITWPDGTTETEDQPALVVPYIPVTIVVE